MGWFAHGSLRGRLMTLVLLAGLPGLGLFVYSGYEQRRLARQSARDDALLLAQLVSMDQERLIQGTREILMLLSHLPEVRDGMQRQRDCSELLAQLLREYPQYVNLGVTDADGNIVCSALAMVEPVPAADRAWFQRAARTRRFAIGEYQVGRVTGKASINFAQPFYDSRKRLRGVVYAALDLDWLNEFAARAKLPKDAVILAVDSGGVILASHPGAEKHLGRTWSDAPWLRPTTARAEGLTELTGLDGVPRLYAHMPLGRASEPAGAPQAYLAVGIPAGGAYAAANRQLWRNVSSFLGVTALALTAIWLGGSWFVIRPLRSLAAATRRIAAGDLGARAGPTVRSGELGELAFAFDAMAGALERNRAEREQTLAELSRWRQEQQIIFDSVPGIILYKDCHNVHLRANAAAAAAMNLPVEQIEGRSAYDMYPPELAEQYYQDDQEVIRSGLAKRGIVERLMYGDGKAHWMRTDKIPYRDAAGNAIGVIVFAIDITEQKTAEQELMLLNEQLEQRVAERTAELVRAMDALEASTRDRMATQMQLIQAEKMDLVGRLAAGVAHEVKNPLSIIGMGLSFLATQPGMGDGDAASVVHQCEEAVRRANGVICGLLDFSAPQRLQQAAGNLNEIIDRSLMLVSHQLARAGIALGKELAADLPPLMLDANKIQQVFLNLFMNAMHAMPEGGELTVRTRWEADGDTVVVAEVEDTGAGIPQDKLDRIFEPFFTTKPTGKGTGLGLTVTKTIVDLHGGRIEVRNRPEGGVCASLRFFTAKGAPTDACPANTVD